MSQFAMHLALPNERKLYAVDKDGKELYKSLNEVRSQQLLRLQQEPPSSAEPAQEDDADKPNPRAVLDCIETAKGELDVVRDLINNVRDQKYMAVETIPRPSNSDIVLQNRLKELLLKLGRKRAALKETAERLRRGAQALAIQQKREDAYFFELAKLQRFWKVQASHQHPECPFTVDLALNKDMAEQLPHGLPAVELYKDAACRLRVQLPRPLQGASLLQQLQAQPGEGSVVGVGAVEVHALLKERQQKLLQHLLQSNLQRMLPHAGATAFLVKYARPAVISTEADSVVMMAVHALVREFCYHHYWRIQAPGQPMPPPAHPAGQAASVPTRVLESTRTMLQDLSFWQSHDMFRRYVRRHLELQALQLGAKLYWTPAWHRLTSAMRVELIPGHFVTVLVQRDTLVEVEGVSGPLDLRAPPALQPHARMGSWDAGRAEVPHLLLNLLQQPK